jgi:biotin synthase-like enzyme
MKLTAAVDSVLCNPEDCAYCSLYKTDRCKLKKEVPKQKISKPKVLCLYASLPEEITKET